MNKLFVMFLIGATWGAACAATVGILDSGVDFEHPQLEKNVVTNSREVPSNGLDDDGNGFIDDVMGWNFVKGNHQVFAYDLLSRFSDQAKELMEINDRRAQGEATEADSRRRLVLSLTHPLLRKEMAIFSLIAHGSHVSGIVSKQSPQSKIVSLKFLGDKDPSKIYNERPLKSQKIRALAKKIRLLLPKQALYSLAAKAFQEEQKRTGMINIFEKDNPAAEDSTEELTEEEIITLANLLERSLKSVVANQRELFEYLKGRNIRVANGSYGYSINMAVANLAYHTKNLLNKSYRKNLKVLVAIAMVKMEESEILIQTMLQDTGHQGILVFAAGNDGLDLDRVAQIPGGIKGEDVISVAAVDGNDQLASFSNYGKEVDVAAPGVNVVSSVPGGFLQQMSGTSMAAPYVAGTLSAMLEVNPNLTNDQLRWILMNSVDARPWLAGKVAAAGVVNRERAVQVAKLVSGKSSTQAFSLALSMAYEVVPTSPKKRPKSAQMVENLVPLPLPL